MRRGILVKKAGGEVARAKPTSTLAAIGMLMILLTLVASGVFAITPQRLGISSLVLAAMFIFTGLIFVVRAALRIPNVKKLLIIFGIVGSTGLSFFNFVLFLLAYVSPTSSFVVPVNTYGEAVAELFLLLITVALVACSSIWVVKHIIKGEKI